MPDTAITAKTLELGKQVLIGNYARQPVRVGP